MDYKEFAKQLRNQAGSYALFYGAPRGDLEKAAVVIEELAARLEPSSTTLSLEELREMAWKQAPVWCSDTDGIHAGLLCIQDEWVTSERTPHIWLLDEEGHSGIYSIDSLLKCGARFYRCRPEEAFTKTTSPNISPN